jgi:hypothetical protein
VAESLGQITISDDINLFHVDSDPSTGIGLEANQGSIAVLKTIGGIGKAFLKTGASNTSWTEFGTSANIPDPENFSFEKINISDIIIIPTQQQMLVGQCIIIDGELVVDGSLSIEV